MSLNIENNASNIGYINDGFNVTMAGLDDVISTYGGPKGKTVADISTIVNTAMTTVVSTSDNNSSSEVLEQASISALTAIGIQAALSKYKIPQATAAAALAAVLDSKAYELYLKLQTVFFDEVIDFVDNIDNNEPIPSSDDNHATIPSNTDVSDWMDQNDPFADPSATQDTIDIPIWGRYDPLVLDLNGDGVTSIALDNSTAHFDLDGDGFAEKTGWIDGSDGFLVLDKNGNGKIDDVSELFGDQNINGFDAINRVDISRKKNIA